MSTSYDVYCDKCNKRSNNEIFRHRFILHDSIVIAYKINEYSRKKLSEYHDFVLKIDYQEVDFKFILEHIDHDLIIIDEYSSKW